MIITDVCWCDHDDDECVWFYIYIDCVSDLGIVLDIHMRGVLNVY